MAVDEGARGWRAGVRALPRVVLLALVSLTAALVQQLVGVLGAPAWGRCLAALGGVRHRGVGRMGEVGRRAA
jgi:hypothetical protein